QVYIYSKKILNKINPGDKDRQCVCTACAEVLKENAKKAEEILKDSDSEDELFSSKRMRLDDDATSISSFRTNFTHASSSSQSSFSKINNENEESQANVQEMLEDLQDETGYITTEEDWQERLEECSYTHPAVDINAKWDLRDIFIRELEKPEFISLSSEFN
ncbi:12059_t:CDS:2, partial [Rhizophagus irregularis]